MATVYAVVCSAENVGVPPQRYDIRAGTAEMACVLAVVKYQGYTEVWTLEHKAVPAERIRTEVLDAYPDVEP